MQSKYSTFEKWLNKLWFADLMEYYGICKMIVYENYIIWKLHMITMLSEKREGKNISKDNCYYVKICRRKKLKQNSLKCQQHCIRLVEFELILFFLFPNF